MNSLFDPQPNLQNTPLAALLRPVSFDDFFGQEHLLGPGRPLRVAIEKDCLPSLIFHGPPGCGKTSLAMLISKQTQSRFVQCNAVTSTLQDVRALIKEAQEARQLYQKKTILFLDELHRFNKAQQDALLPHVEDGIVTLVGATTENPYFSIIRPLLSRARVVTFEALTESELCRYMYYVMAHKIPTYCPEISFTDDAVRYSVQQSDGDVRAVLYLIEHAMRVYEKQKKTIDATMLKALNVEKNLTYDSVGDSHYDTASAFIKSIRGSDPDAALYWLAKMVECGEDLNFIGRRLTIFASEDIGNADPHAVSMAMSCWMAARQVGYPEARIILAQVTTYLACAPKSNAAYKAINAALVDIKQNPVEPIPAYLKSSDHKAKKQYKYPHQYPGHYVKQSYKQSDTQYYFPTENGYEIRLKKRLEAWKKQK